MTSSRHLALLGVLLVLASCADQKAPSAGSAPAPLVAAQNQAGPALPQAARALRITVETSVVVADLDAAAQAVRASVAELGGYVGEARIAGGEETRYASFEVHVPVARLPAFRERVAKLGEVSSDAEKAEDVTEQRADLEARLRNARAQEKRLLDLLAEKAGTLADVVAVEKELASVRENVERMEAQQRVLEGQIANATVKVQLHTRHTAARPGPGRRIARAAGEGISTAGAFLVGLAVFLASAGPTLLLVAALGYGLYRAVRFLVQRRRIPPPPPSPA
jgi:hypothetical protein